MTARRTLLRLLRLALVGLATLLVVPSGGVQPAAISLYTVETAKGVDFEDGQLWVLVLGADSEGRTDAIHLVGIDSATNFGVALGIPRDTWLDMPGIGLARINEAYREGGPKATADAVADLTGIAPDLVLHMDSGGFLDLMSTLGPVEVRTPEEFTNDGVHVEKGLNTFSPRQALAYVDYRVGLDRGDFDRSANQQRTLRGIHARIRSQADRPGFIERGVMTVLQHMSTNASPGELFEIAQAIAQVEPRRITTCVIRGRVGFVGAASVVFPDVRQARRLGAAARTDATLKGCR